MTDTKVVSDYLVHVTEEIEGVMLHLDQTRQTIRSARLQMGDDPVLRLLIGIINDTDDSVQEMMLAWNRYRDAMAVIGICQEEDDEDGKDDEGRRETEQ